MLPTLQYCRIHVWFAGPLLLLAGLFTPARAQEQVLKGVVEDAVSHQPLAFVSLTLDSGWVGTATGTDGRFRLRIGPGHQFLLCSYLGYESQRVELAPYRDSTARKDLLIRLRPQATALREVVVSSDENPALAIIRQVRQNRSRNDPERLPAFRYHSYNKFYLTVEPSRRQEKPRKKPRSPEDSLRRAKKELRWRNFLDQSYLFLMETVTQRDYRYRNQSKEKVFATRVSGLKNPQFAVLATDFQPFSFYHDYVYLLQVNYLNPLGNGSLSRYQFQLEQSVVREADTLFVVSFAPKPGKTFEALKGVLSISSRQYALENVVAEPVARADVQWRIQQKYAWIPPGAWFPVEMSTNFTIVDDKEQSVTSGVNQSYLQAIDLSPTLGPEAFDEVSLELPANAVSQPDTFWTAYRPEPLNEKELRTYHMVDSLSRKTKLESKVNLITGLVRGKIPLGVVDLELPRVLSLNRIENVRLGLGLRTNPKLSPWFTLGGYWGYGFRDQEAKYGGDLSLHLNRRSDMDLQLVYFRDLLESGGTAWYREQTRPFSSASFRDFLLLNKDRVERREVAWRFRTFRYLETRLSLNRDDKQVTNGYRYRTEKADEVRRFIFSEWRLALRYAFGEQFVRTPQEKLSMGSQYPVFWLQGAWGMKGLAGGQFDYRRIDARLESTFLLPHLGKTRLTVETGYIQGNIPYSNLYNGKGNYDPNLLVYTGAGFETMGLSEFMASRYASVHLEHNFGRLLFRSKWLQPEFLLVSHVGFGALRNPQNHLNIPVRSFERGLYETGLLISKITFNQKQSFNMAGGAFYRYGPYARPQAQDNWVFKLSGSINF
ncbi:MAG TPA: DUF5686 family protein [Spirosoma sp.]|nr:DUF5686 family protein [Spirosoma sp.]